MREEKKNIGEIMLRIQCFGGEAINGRSKFRCEQISLLDPNNHLDFFFHLYSNKTARYDY